MNELKMIAEAYLSIADKDRRIRELIASGDADSLSEIIRLNAEIDDERKNQANRSDDSVDDIIKSFPFKLTFDGDSDNALISFAVDELDWVVSHVRGELLPCGEIFIGRDYGGGVTGFGDVITEHNATYVGCSLKDGPQRMFVSNLHRGNVVHEFGHIIENINNGISEATNDYLDNGGRTETPYGGRRYPNGLTEVVSTGIEFLYLNRAFKCKEHEKLVKSLLFC